MKAKVSISREIEFTVEVQCHRADEGGGWEYEVEDDPVVDPADLGLRILADGKVMVELMKGEVAEAIDAVAQGEAD